MVKKGYFECNKCKRVFKGKRSFTHHICGTEVNQKCYICNYVYPSNQMSRHVESCQYRQYLRLYWSSIWFFFKLIMIYNDNLKMYNYIGTSETKRDFIRKMLRSDTIIGIQKHSLDLRKYKSEFLKEVENKEQKEKDFIKQQSDELNNTNDYNEQVLIEVSNEFSPSISGREIIFNFFKKRNIENSKLRSHINMRLQRFDYPTDSELLWNSYLYQKMKKIRRESIKYNEDYLKFSNLLEDIIDNNDKYKCFYCKKLILHKIKHYKICDLCEKSFNHNKTSFIYTFLNINYDTSKFKEQEENDIVFYFKNKTFEQFINNISSYIHNKVSTRSKIENDDIKDKNRKFNVKEFISEFIKEFDNDKNKEQNITDLDKGIDENDNIDDIDNNDDNKENDNDNDNKNDNMNNNELDENRTLVYKTDNEDNDEDEKEIPSKKQQNQIQRTTDMVFKSIINNPTRLKVNNVQFINNIDRYIHTVKNNKDENENNDNDNE